MKTTPSLVKFIVFAIVTILATGTLAATIANIQPGDRNTFTALFSDVTGLAKGHEVRIAGVRVGTVKSIDVAPDRTNAAVEFDVLSSSVPARPASTVGIHAPSGARNASGRAEWLT